MTDRISVSLAEAGRLVDLSEDYIRRAVHRTAGNKLPARLIGKRKYRVLVEDLVEWFKDEGEDA